MMKTLLACALVSTLAATNPTVTITNALAGEALMANVDPAEHDFVRVIAMIRYPDNSWGVLHNRLEYVGGMPFEWKGPYLGKEWVDWLVCVMICDPTGSQVFALDATFISVR
jgi:hypothetical protein